MVRRPNIYVKGTEPKFTLSALDADGNEILPTVARLSIKRPYTGVVFTVTQTAMTNETTKYTYRFTTASGVGWYPYETFVEDSSGNGVADQHGFWIVDRVQE